MRPLETAVVHQSPGSLGVFTRSLAENGINLQSIFIMKTDGEDVHIGYEEGRPAVFCRNANGWVTIPKKIKLPDSQQDRDMIARELLIKFQMSPKNPLVDLKKAYKKF